MVKKNAKKGKAKGKKTLIDEKKKALQKFWDFINSQFEEYENMINSQCNDSCAKVSKMYQDKLKSLPENIRNMTLAEYMQNEMQKKVEIQQSVETDVQVLSSQFERTKLLSEKKKTHKKSRIERKRSLSVSASSGYKVLPSNLMHRTSRVLSESALSTPLSKMSVAPAAVVTPKFNPKRPISKAFMRKPRAGEVVMSLSGSPLLNFVDEIPEKPGSVSVSLGNGKFINIPDDTDISKLENDFAKKLDEDTKNTLASVKEKLEKILKS